MTTFVGGSDSGGNERLEQVLAEYLRSIESGRPLDRQLLFDQYADLADELRSFFTNFDAMERIARPLAGQTPIDEPTLGPGAVDDSSNRVRYFGEYELLAEIARGGMGIVYKARQVKLRRTVAVKMILAGQLASGDHVKRFYAEAQAAASLHHPNIVAIHEVGQHAGQHYFSMDFIDGESLAQRIARSPMPAREAADVLRKVALAVSFAHAKDVVHRDLKPANILMDHKGEPHVSDFGLAKQAAGLEDASVGALTATGQVLGTPSYMPPEQAAGKSAEIGPHSDVYSLGAILYCMLTGRPPFQAASAMDTLMQVLQSDPVSPRSLNRSVPIDLTTICLKCLEKDPRRRYASAAELVEELERFLRGEPIQARPLGWLEITWRRLHRQQRILQSVAATTVATILVIALGYIVWDWQRERQIGQLTLKTDGLPLTADLQLADAKTSSMTFTIPTEQPLRLTRGEYRLRASGAGMLSQDFLMTLEAGRERGFSLDLTEDRFWAPLRLEPSERAVSITIGNRVDLLLFESRFQRSALRRLDGGTLRPIWTLPLDAGLTLPPGLDPAQLNRWRDLAQPWLWSGSHGPLCLGLDKSLDTDTLADLILCWPTQDELPCVALSGGDGAIRWMKTSTGQFDRLAAAPLITHVDDDPAPDLVRLGYRSGRGDLWIEAVSGVSGATIWRTELPALAALDPNDQYQRIVVLSEGYQFPCELVSTTDAGHKVVVAMTSRQALLVDLRDGQPRGVPLTFGDSLAARPQLADVDADGTPELLLITSPLAAPGTRAASVELRVQSFGATDSRWKSTCPISANALLRLDRLSRRVWGRLADLDHDGQMEWILPSETAFQPGAARLLGLAIRVYDAVLGQERWTHTVYPREGATCDELLVMPDVNDDGNDEVVVISSSPDGADSWNNPVKLFVDILDGATGERLATWSDASVRNDFGGFVSNRRFESAHWWGADARGFPQLVVATIDESAQRNRRQLHVISPLEGRATHRLDDVNSWQLPDLDGDGRDDLLVVSESPDGQQIQGLRSKSPIAWRRLGKLQPAQDFNGDGLVEFVEVDGAEGRALGIVDGRDGRRRRSLQPTWSTPALRAPIQVSTWPAPLGDFGGDSTADVLLTGEYHLDPQDTTARQGKHPFPLQAIDAASGIVLWREPSWSLPSGLLDRSPQGMYVVGLEARCEDLDDDGRAELLVAYRLEWGESGWSGKVGQLWMAAFDSRSGAFLWQHAVGGIRKLPSAIGCEELPWFVAPEVVDLNGDRTRDLVVIVPRPARDDYPAERFEFDIEAVSGVDGQTLWSPYRLAVALSNIRNSDPMTARMPVVTTAVLAPGERPTIIVAETLLDPTKYDPAVVTRTCRVTALRGHDGGEVWRYEWQSGGAPSEHNASQLNIANMSVDANGKRVIVIREYDQTPNVGGDALTWLNSDGTLVRRTMGDKSWTYQSVSTRLWPIDVDGDGREELALSRSGRIRMLRADGSSVWSDTVERFGEVSAVESTSDGPRLIVVDGSGYAAIEPRSGRLLWRADAGVASATHPRETKLIASTTRLVPPRILVVGDDSLVRVAQLVDAVGRFQPLPRDGKLVAPRADARFVRRLPWDYAGRVDSRLGLYGLCGFALIIFPVGVIYLSVRRGRWSLRAWLVLPALVLYELIAMNLLLRLGAGRAVAPSLVQLWTTALGGTLVFVFPALVARWSWRRQWTRLVCLGGGSLVLSAVFGGISCAFAVQQLGPGESFRWTWLPLLNLWWPAAMISGLIGLVASSVRRVTRPRAPSIPDVASRAPRWPLLCCAAGAVSVLEGTAAMLGAMFIAYRTTALGVLPFASWFLVATGALTLGVWLVRRSGPAVSGKWWIYVAVAVGGVVGAVVTIFVADAGIVAVSNTSYELWIRVWGRTIPLTRGSLESLEGAMLFLGVGLGWSHVLAGGLAGALTGILARRVLGKR